MLLWRRRVSRKFYLQNQLETVVDLQRKTTRINDTCFPLIHLTVSLHLERCIDCSRGGSSGVFFDVNITVSLLLAFANDDTTVINGDNNSTELHAEKDVHMWTSFSACNSANVGTVYSERQSKCNWRRPTTEILAFKMHRICVYCICMFNCHSVVFDWMENTYHVRHSYSCVATQVEFISMVHQWSVTEGWYGSMCLCLSRPSCVKVLSEVCRVQRSHVNVPWLWQKSTAASN